MSNSPAGANSVTLARRGGTALQRIASCVLVGLCTLGSLGHGQAPTVADYRLRVTQLSHIWEAARAAEGSVRGLTGPLDTIQLGSLAVVAVAARRAVVAAAVQGAWDRLDSALGSDTDLLAGKTFYTRLAATHVAISDSGVNRVFMDAPGVEQLRWNLLRSVMGALLQELDEDTRAWFGGVLPIEGVLEPPGRSAYIELVLARSPGASECLRGDLALCRAVLGFADGGIRPDSAFAVSATVRHHFARVALEQGRERAYARLLRSADVSLEQRLAAAAGLSADSLLEVWHATLIQAQPELTLVTRPIVVSGFAWVLVFLLLSSRSSRWRLG